MKTDPVTAEFLRLSRTKLKTEYPGKIKACLDILSEEDVWWRAHETDNSIGNLLLHLEGNTRQWIVAGVGGAPDRRERSKEFAERAHRPKEELFSLLTGVLNEADVVLANLTPELLTGRHRIQGYDVTCLEAVGHVVEHFSYHTGQVVYITKLRTGKDLKFYDL